MRRGRILACLLLIIAGLAIYHNSFGNPLFWDDEETVIRNVWIRSWKHLPEVFTHNYHAGSGITLSFYRPLTTVSFMINYQLGGLAPFGYHLGNVLIHIAAALLLFRLLLTLFGNDRIAGLTAALFLIHPLNSEAVNYVSNRTDPLMLCFFLLAFYLYVLYRRQGNPLYLAGTALAWVCSVFSKEMGIVLPLFLIAYDQLLHPLSVPKQRVNIGRMPAYLLFAALSIGYVLLRSTIDLGERAQPFNPDPLVRQLVMAKGFLIYLRLLIWPFNLHMEYDRPVVSGRFDPGGWFALCFFLAVIAALWQWGRHRKEARVTFGVVWFLLGLLPISGLLIPLNNTVSEHYIYLAAPGLFLCAAAAAVALWEKAALRQFRTALAAAGLLLLAGLGVLTYRQNTAWSDPLEFFLRITRLTTGSFRANNNAGMEFWRRKDMAKAEEYFRRSVEINPYYAVAVNNVGYIHDSKGELEQAEAYFEKAVRLDPTYLHARNNLANVYVRRQKFKEAYEQLQYILKKFPYDTKSRDLLKFIPPEYQKP